MICIFFSYYLPLYSIAIECITQKLEQLLQIGIMCCRRLKDSHIWLSVVSRYPHSNFTSVQRLSCCVSQLLTFMLVNIVFYNVDKEDSEAEIDIGFFSITWAEITIGL